MVNQLLCFLGSPFQCLITFSVKKVFLVSSLCDPALLQPLQIAHGHYSKVPELWHCYLEVMKSLLSGKLLSTTPLVSALWEHYSVYIPFSRLQMNEGMLQIKWNVRKGVCEEKTPRFLLFPVFRITAANLFTHLDSMLFLSTSVSLFFFLFSWSVFFFFLNSHFPISHIFTFWVDYLYKMGGSCF